MSIALLQFVVEHSVEERMLLLQEKKRKLAAGIFGAKPSAEENRQKRIQEIKQLIDL
jgi:SNF2 family DNA or RNA helicase